MGLLSSIGKAFKTGGMSLIGDVIGAGASLFGAKKASDSQEKIAAKSEALAREQFDAQMDETVQRRVKDATAAGLHPLYALGASAGASPTAHISGQSASGTLIGEGIAQAGRQIQSALDPVSRAQVRQLDASAGRDEAEAAYITSKTKRAEQEALSGPVRTFPATEPSPFRGKPIGIDTPMGYFTPQRPNMAEDLEQHYGGAMDALGLVQFLNEWWNNPARVGSANKQREETRAFIRNLLEKIR